MACRSEESLVDADADDDGDLTVGR
jgi:hypothetical protein